jgi:hypothetical protein
MRDADFVSKPKGGIPVTRTLGILTALALVLCLALPEVALAGKKNKKKNRQRRAQAERTQRGIGPGGVPALRDYLQGQVDALGGQFEELVGRVESLETIVLLLETQIQELEESVALNTDDDMDGFSENQGDCDDTNAEVYPDALEDETNGIDDDCDGEVDEAPVTPAP